MAVTGQACRTGLHRGPEGLGIRRQRKPQLSGREKSTARSLPRGAIREETPLPPEGTRVPIPALLLPHWGASSKPPHLRWPLRPLTSQMGTITVLVKITRNSDWKMLRTGAGPEQATSVTFTGAVPVRPQIPPASLLPEASLHQQTARNPTPPAAGPGWGTKGNSILEQRLGWPCSALSQGGRPLVPSNAPPLKQQSMLIALVLFRGPGFSLGMGRALDPRPETSWEFPSRAKMGGWV